MEIGSDWGRHSEGLSAGNGKGGDVFLGDRLREINAAYAILSNPQKRTAYDAKLSKIRTGSEPKPEYCYRCEKPTLYWDIERDKALCNDCGRTAAATMGFD